MFSESLTKIQLILRISYCDWIDIKSYFILDSASIVYFLEQFLLHFSFKSFHSFFMTSKGVKKLIVFKWVPFYEFS